METDYYVDVEIDNSINVESTESGQHICEGSLVNPIKEIFSPALRGFKMKISSISSV